VSKFEQKDMSGSLFKNENKASDRHPDYSGTATIDGVEMFMDAWIKTADTGRKWMSFSFKPKQKQAAAPAAKQPARQQRDEPIDDIPW
jgi:uncharacterized protein (DUF736 family)